MRNAEGRGDMEYISLTEPEKAELFDEIAALFYKQNFGMASKSEIELLMFHIYLEKMIQQNINADGTLDYNQCSDYRISRELGITPQRVNNLKLRSHMVHPIEFEWEKSFATLIEHAYYDKERQTVIVSIPDPTLMMKIQEEIELKGGFYEKQLNSKLLQMKACYFVQLMAVVEPEATKGELIKAMKQSFKKQAKEERPFGRSSVLSCN